MKIQINIRSIKATPRELMTKNAITIIKPSLFRVVEPQQFIKHNEFKVYGISSGNIDCLLFIHKGTRISVNVYTSVSQPQQL